MNTSYLLHALPSTAGTFAPLGAGLPAAELLHNGTELPVPEAARERLLFVLRGEADCTIDGWPLRLTAGGWTTIPAGAEGRVHVYRSVGSAQLLLFVADRGGEAGALAFGNAWDMPTAEGHPQLFGFENGLLTGQLLAAGEQYAVEGAALAADMKGSFTVDGIATEGCAEIPVGQSCAVTGGEGTVVFRAFDSREVEAYKEWMQQAYGIRWDSGLHRAAE